MASMSTSCYNLRIFLWEIKERRCALDVPCLQVYPDSINHECYSNKNNDKTDLLPFHRLHPFMHVRSRICREPLGRISPKQRTNTHKLIHDLPPPRKPAPSLRDGPSSATRHLLVPQPQRSRQTELAGPDSLIYLDLTQV